MDKGFNILHKIVQAASARQKVISSNIANADTPGYKAKDVKFGSFVEKAGRMMATDPKHITSSNGGDVDVSSVSP